MSSVRSIALAGSGQAGPAIAHYRTALKIRPDYAEAPQQPRHPPRGARAVNETIAHYDSVRENLGAVLAERNGSWGLDMLSASLRACGFQPYLA